MTRDLEDVRVADADDADGDTACSICGESIEVGQRIANMNSPNLLHRVALEESSFVDLAMEAHDDGVGVVFVVHEGCALHAEIDF